MPRLQHKAFSLIEVVVALAIFAMTIAVLTQAVNNSLRAIEVVKVDSEREQYYRFSLQQILQIQDRAELEDGGEYKMPNGREIKWEVGLDETEILDLFKINRVMQLEQSGGFRGDRIPDHFEVIYVWRPEWSIADERSTLLQDKKDALAKYRTGF